MLVYKMEYGQVLFHMQRSGFRTCAHEEGAIRALYVRGTDREDDFEFEYAHAPGVP